jgi:O-antigen/teichoic acid export membrane protein
MMERIANLSLRGATLFCRFGLVLVLAKYLTPEEVGLWGLFFAAISFFVMMIGLDFYAFSNREIVSADTTAKLGIISNQLVLYCLIYLVCFPVIVLLFLSGFLPWSLFVYFALILILEHITQESYRLFVAIGKPLSASFIFFVRGGLWVIPAMFVFSTHEELRSINTPLTLWLLAGVMGLAFSIISLFRIDIRPNLSSLDFNWIKRGIRIAAPFFLGTIALRIVLSLDRFFMEHATDLSTVGVYTVYIGICSVMISLAEASVFSFIYPQLIDCSTSRDRKGFRVKLAQLTVQTTMVTAGLALCIHAIAPSLFAFLDKPIYAQNIEMLEVLIVAYALYTLSHIAHYGLYAMKADTHILICHALGLIVFLAGFFMLRHYFPSSEIVPTSLALAFAAILASKFFFLILSYRRFFIVGAEHVQQ